MQSYREIREGREEYDDWRKRNGLEEQDTSAVTCRKRGGHSCFLHRRQHRDQLQRVGED